jgi:hypothetical protein
MIYMDGLQHKGAADNSGRTAQHSTAQHSTLSAFGMHVHAQHADMLGSKRQMPVSLHSDFVVLHGFAAAPGWLGSMLHLVHCYSRCHGC